MKRKAESPFEGQVAVITGGARGIGYAVAEHLGSQGAKVVIVDVLENVLNESVKSLKAEKIEAISVQCDVTSEKSVNSMMEQTINTFKKIDIMVNCAGITGKTAIKTHEVELDDFKKVFAINVDGIFLCCKAALKHMKEANYGRIVNIASISGKEGNAGMLAYSASKAGVIGLTKVMGKEYAETGITVNCIAPAVVRTAMVDALPETQVNYMTSKIPMGRCGKLDEIAGLVAYIASPAASFTTAFCYDASGGRATY